MNQRPGHFHLGDLLSITTDRLLSPDHMDGLYRLIDHVTGQAHMTHQLPRAADEIRPFLVDQFPWLDGLAVPADVTDNTDLMSWMSWAAAQHGEYHEVKPMPFGQYIGREPMAELREMRPDAKVIIADEEGRS